MNILPESRNFTGPSIYQDGESKTRSDFAKQWCRKGVADEPETNAANVRLGDAGYGHMAPYLDRIGIQETLTFAWADSQERKRVIALCMQEGRQTMNLRTREGAELVVLRRSNGQLAGWTGVDIKTDPVRPELFSQFVYPRFRGIGLGALLERFWWTYLDSQGYSIGFMRMELDSNQTLIEHRLRSGYCRRATPEELGQQFITACRNCELFGTACHRQIFLAVDVQKALAVRNRSSGPLDIDSLPLRIAVEPKIELDTSCLHGAKPEVTCQQA